MKSSKPKARVTGNAVRRRGEHYEALLLVSVPPDHKADRTEAAVRASKSVGPSSSVAVYLNDQRGEVRYAGDDRAAVAEAHTIGRDVAKSYLKQRGYSVGGSCA